MGGRTPAIGAGSAWPAVIPAALTLVVTLYQIQRPSYWGDEAATLSAIRRSLPQLIRLLGHTDAVHGAYYLTEWAWVRIAGNGGLTGGTEFLVRFPSAVAMAVAAGFTTLLGRRLVSARAGMMAGLVFAALPDVSWYGQDARSYAMVTALATIASYLFVRALEDSGRARRRRLIGYGGALALLGLANLFGFLLVGAHAVALAVRLRSGAPATRAEARPVALGWLAAVAAAAVAISPVAALGWVERRQIHWIKKPSLGTALRLPGMLGPQAMVAAVSALVAAALVVSAVRGRLGADWPARLTALALPWLVLPAAVLLTASQAVPVYQSRYIVFCLPAAALLAGTALAAIGWLPGLAALVVVAFLALPAQARARESSGHGQDLRKVSQLLASQARPGDAVWFANHFLQELEWAYPDGFRALHDVSLGKTAVQAGGLTGTTAPTRVILARLRLVRRLWMILNVKMAAPSLAQQGFTLVRTWRVSIFRLDFFRRVAT